MTSSIKPVAILDETNLPVLNNTNGTKHNHKCRHVLKSKENTLRHKCNKALRRKLKQYRLRPDGKEDQDILDVSDILITSLTIKSPGSKDNQSVLSERPKNYLFRMVRNNKKRIANGISKEENGNIENENVSHDISQDKKQTNAFKLLMDSRNKSIGSNSPGKEKSNDENEDQEILQNKNVKAKRVLVLQKMAEAKGSLRKKELEESQDKYITAQMRKRAEKFKNMLLNQEPKSQEADEKNQIHKNKTDTKNQNNNDGLKAKNDSEIKQVKSLQLVSLFSSTEIDPEKKRVKKNKEQLSEEDKEFLNKLSPSLKKKGNMLCYFTKIEKDSELSLDNVEDDVIKVKLPTKSKRKHKSKKKHIPSEICDNNLMQNITNIPPPELFTESNENRLKRKRNLSLLKKEVTHAPQIIEETLNRPKRATKKPVKYNDDIFLSSSDEELHIFTPKKKKHTDKQDPSVAKPPEDIKTIDISKSPLSLLKTEKTIPKKSNVKLAPIFNSKQKPDAVASEAKQKFLQSGVPEKLKKAMAQQKSNNTVDIYFQTVVHVQQKDSIIDSIRYPILNISDSSSDDEIECQSNDGNIFNGLLNLSSHNITEKMSVSQTNSNLNQMLQQIKLTRPKFPVYRTYRLLRDKKKGEFRGINYLDLDNSVEINNSNLEICNENPDQLSWTDKYKAMSTNQIIGNFESVKELKKWLVSWTEMHQKSKCNDSSDSSDFYHSDTDSRDSAKNSNNLLIITGPTGSGKTSSVYAVAADLAIKVIEVNASHKRTGKIMLQDLQEATQSHKVNRGATSSDNISKSQEVIHIEANKKIKKRGRPKKYVEKHSVQVTKEIKKDFINALTGSQEIIRTDTSLILIDDADIVFDQDDGFCSAIAQLVHSSKRPVILVTSSLSCPHLQRFLPNGKILKMNPLMPRILGTWLDLMCLADSGTCFPETGSKFLNYFKGDVRKTINSLQFYVSSQPQNSENEEIASQNSDTYKLNIDDEQSSTSWVDQEDNEEKTVGKHYSFKKGTDYLWSNFINTQMSVDQYPFNKFDIWWNVPQYLKLEDDKADSSRLASIANVVDSISISDYYSHITPNSRLNITSEPWFSSENHSVSEQEDMNNYKKCAEVCDEISYELIKNSLNVARKRYVSSEIIDIGFPGMAMQRERDRIVSRHNNLTSHLYPSVVMDRRALALDYWSSCRAVCRIEKTKSDTYSKRNNRFCHYLKSLNIRCKNESFDNLCNSLSCVQKYENNLEN